MIGDPDPLYEAPRGAEAWYPYLAAIGCPDQPGHGGARLTRFWEDRAGDLPKHLPDGLPGMPCTIKADARGPDMRSELRGYRVGDAVLLAELNCLDSFSYLSVRLCYGQLEAGREAGEIVGDWAGIIGLAVTFSSTHPTERDSDIELLIESLRNPGPSAYRSSHSGIGGRARTSA